MEDGNYQQSMKDMRKIVLHWAINHKGTISVEDVICFGKLYYARGYKDCKDQEKKNLNSLDNKK